MMRYYDVHFQIKDYGYSIFVMATTENEAVETITNGHLYQESEDLDYIDYIDEITEQEYKEIKGK